MEWVRGRDALVALAVALLAGTVAVLPPFELLHGWSIDALTALRWRVFGNRYEPSSSPTVVIGLDEESYRTPPFKGSPTVIWTREIGRVLTAVVEGGARVIGVDVVFPTSIEQSEIPFGEDTLGARLRGFDRDFLRALNAAGRAHKLVLGEILLREFIHGRDERFDAGDRLEGIPVGLPLVKTRIGIERGHQQERQYNRNQRQQRQIGKVGKLFEHMQIDGIVQSPVRRPETEESNRRLHKNALENVAMHVVPQFVRQHSL